MASVLGSLPDIDMIELVIALALCILLGAYVFFRNVLDLKASLIAAIIGFCIIMFTDLFWFLLLLFFLAISYLVTVWKYKEKRAQGAEEGMLGERGMGNVIANGSVPLSIAILSAPIDSIHTGLSGFLFIASIAIATSDTFGSEVGVLARNPRLITDLKRKVRPGVDGGVSFLGNMAALVGSLLIVLVGMFLVTDELIASPVHDMAASTMVLTVLIAIGWLGCQFDSLLGATIQHKGLVSNNMVNFITIFVGTVASIPIYLLIA